MTRGRAVLIALCITSCQIVLGDLSTRDPSRGGDDAALTTGDGTSDGPEVVLTFVAAGIDPGFNGGQVRVIPELFESRVVLADASGGRLYVAGSAGREIDRREPSTFAVVALDAHSAESDPGFGARGIVRVERETPNTRDRLQSAALSADGRIWLAGNIAEIEQLPFGGVARLERDGTIDRSFAQSGVVRFAPSNALAVEIRGVAAYPDDRLMIAGRLQAMDGEWETLLTRFSNDGGRDTSWNFVQRDLGYDEGAWDVIVEPSQAVVFAGEKRSDGDPKTTFDAFMARFLPGASFDNTFAATGRRSLSLPSGDDSAFGVAAHASGYYVAGAYDGERVGFVANVTSDGGRHPTFGTSRDLTREAFVEVGASLRDIAVDDQGRALVAGWRATTSGTEGIVARLTTEGQLDGTFGVGGIRTVSCEGGDVRMRSIAVLGDGAVVATGEVSREGRFFRGLVVRY